MADSLSAMGEAFAALSKQHPTKRDDRSGNLDRLKGKTKKTGVAVSGTEETNSESDDAHVHKLLATNAENDSAECTKTSSANSLQK